MNLVSSQYDRLSLLSDMKGLRRWIERMDWVISNYVEQRQSYANVKDLQLVSTSTENHYRDSYNYTVQNVAIF